MAELEIKPALTMRLRVAGLVCAAAILAITLIYLLAGGGQDFFAVRSTLITYMPDADGLMASDDVRLNGFQIGEVESVGLTGSLNPNRIVEVKMSVPTRYLKAIPRDSETAVGSDTMVGDKFIGITPGESPLPAMPDGVLRTQPATQVTDRADVIKALRGDLDQVNQILAGMASPNTDIGKFILGDQEYDTVLAHIQGFDAGLHTLLAPQSNLGQAFYSLKMYDRIHGFVLQLDKDLASIQNGEGATGHSFASDEQYNAILGDISSLRTSLADINAGKGKLGAALQDDADWQRITKLLGEADSAIAGFNAGQGKAGTLLSNSQIYESLNGSLTKIDAMLRDIREHPQKYTRFKR